MHWHSFLDVVAGVKIISSLFMVEDGEPCEVRRSWAERFLSIPWRPCKATKTIIPKVPMKKFLKLPDGTYVAHPQTVNEIRDSLSSAGPGRAKEFLDEMELLLEEYEISKIDLCWAPNHNTP